MIFAMCFDSSLLCSLATMASKRGIFARFVSRSMSYSLVSVSPWEISNSLSFTPCNSMCKRQRRANGQSVHHSTKSYHWGRFDDGCAKVDGLRGRFNFAGAARN
jgi:hypothetical protein